MVKRGIVEMKHVILLVFAVVFVFSYVDTACGVACGYKICQVNPWFEADAKQLHHIAKEKSPTQFIKLAGPRNDWLSGAVMLVAAQDVSVTVGQDLPKELEGKIQLRVVGKIKARDPNAVVWDPIMTEAQVKGSARYVINGESIKDFPLLRVSPQTPALIWITVDLRDIAAGQYVSKLTFTDSKNKVKVIPLKVEVLDAEIPVKNPLRCFMWQYSTKSPVMIQDLIDHGINIFHVNHQASWDNGAEFLLFFFGPSWHRKPITEGTYDEVKKELDRLWGVIEDNNVPLDSWAIQVADEVSDKSYEIDVEYAKLVKKYKPETPICFNPAFGVAADSHQHLTTLDKTIKNIAPYCDIWMPYAWHLWGADKTGSSVYDFINEDRNTHGKRFWAYDIWGAASRRPSAGRSMFRRGPYVAWKYRIEGFSNYALNAWWSQQPWNHVTASLNYSLIYSNGDPPIAGRSYEVLRQGFQEYKKMYRLKELGMPVEKIDELVLECANAEKIETFDTVNRKMDALLVRLSKRARNEKAN